MSKKNEIIVNEKQFVNTACGKSVKAWFKAADGMNKSTWAAAKAVYDMIAFETWKADFTNQAELAKFLGSSQSQISKMSRAYEYYIRAVEEDLEGNVTMLLDGFTLAAVTAIMKIERVMLKDFIKRYNITRETPSRDITEYVKDYLIDDGDNNEIVDVGNAEDNNFDDGDNNEIADVGNAENNNEIFSALVIIEKRINEIAKSGEVYDVDLDRIERALNDLKILLI